MASDAALNRQLSHEFWNYMMLFAACIIAGRLAQLVVERAQGNEPLHAIVSALCVGLIFSRLWPGDRQLFKNEAALACAKAKKKLDETISSVLLLVSQPVLLLAAATTITTTTRFFACLTILMAVNTAWLILRTRRNSRIIKEIHRDRQCANDVDVLLSLNETMGKWILLNCLFVALSTLELGFVKGEIMESSAVIYALIIAFSIIDLVATRSHYLGSME